ncbi:MAG: DNA-binding protein [Bacteroides sp.]|nr:DNA-binding protein [Bacteroides sp.]
MEMEKFVRSSILYDFYGELLTEHQKRIYEDIIFDDMSYTEVAAIEGISRQGVYDLVKRCEKILEEYENKLKLVEKFQNTKAMVAKIQAIAKEMKEANADAALVNQIKEIEQLSNAIQEEY